VHDVRLAIRQLRRRPWFTAIAVITLAIGLGVNTVAFGVVNGLLIKGFKGKTANDVGRIVTIPGGDEGGYASMPEYERFAEAARDALDIGAEGRASIAWRHDGITESAWVLFVSANYFSMVNATTIAGLLRVRHVADGPPSIVIGERFWRRKLGAAPLAGLTLVLNNTDVSVAGVIPESFTGPAGIYSPDVWLPMDDLERLGRTDLLRNRDTRWLFVMGQLRPGASAPQVQTLVDAAVATMAREWPATHKDRRARFRMLGEGNSELRGLTIGAAIGMGIIGLVLLLACFNVANLLLARAVERERDMGIRAALGASRGRLMRLVVTEGFVIAALSGVLALVLAWWTQSLVTSFAIPMDEPQHIDLTPDRTVLLFIAGLVVVAGVLPGLWPAFAAARVNVSRVLGSQGANAAGGRPSPLRRWLVGAQIAGSTVFVTVAALLLQSYGYLLTTDFGFAKERLLVAEFRPAANGYTADRARRYVDALSARVATLSGVDEVAVADNVPFFIGFDRQTVVWPSTGACEAGGCPAFPTYAVSRGYFRTMGIPLAEGREFDDGRSAGQVVINQPFARKQWPAGDALGATLRIGAEGTPVTVVGITAKTHTRGLDREAPVLFVPVGLEHFERGLALVVRTAAPPSSLVRPVVDLANAVDANVPMQSVKTMEERMAVQLWPFRTLSRMFSLCGGLAVILAVVGLAGVVAHAVSRRTREFGVRVSIGATPRDLLVDVLKSSALLMLPGLVVGLALAAGAARLTQAVFLGVNVLNPLVYLGVAIAHGLIVLVACIGPALRASRLDPLVALRTD
jgi:putative ABC transport system permease protein